MNVDLTAILFFLVAIGLLKIFYKAFKNTWPELYFSSSDYISLFVSTSAIRYFSFTLLPTVLVTALVSAIAYKEWRIEYSLWYGVLVGLFHGTTSNGISFYKLVTRDGSVKVFFDRYFQIVMHLVSIILLCLAGIVGILISKTPVVMGMIPSIDGIVDNLWAAFLSSILTGYLIQVYGAKFVSSIDIVSRSFDSLSAEIIREIEKASAKYRADKVLVMAICTVENIQRPLWVRNIEKLKSRVFKLGTYGIMQVKSNQYIPDALSIDSAVKKYFSNTQDKEWTDVSLKRAILKYNNDKKYLNLVLEAYYYLSPKG